MNPELHSFTALVQQYHPMLTRFARFIIRNEEASIAIAGQALINLWACQKQLQHSSEARNFLRNNTRILSHSWLHQQVLRLTYRNGMDDHHTPIITAWGPTTQPAS